MPRIHCFASGLPASWPLPCCQDFRSVDCQVAADGPLWPAITYPDGPEVTENAAAGSPLAGTKGEMSPVDCQAIPSEDVTTSGLPGDTPPQPTATHPAVPPAADRPRSGA